MAGPENRLALIELLERDGRVRRAFEVERWPVTLGRAIDNDMVLDDPHVAAHHLTIAQVAGEGPADAANPALCLQVGDTRNGVQLGPRTLMAGESAPLPPPGESWQVGGLRLRVRRPGEALEPERTLGLAVTGARPLVTLVCALGLWALALLEHGVDLDPGSSLTDWLVPLLGLPVALALWSVAWAIGSKLFQHRFEFLSHFALISKGLLVAEALDLLAPVLAFSLSWAWLARITPALVALVLAGTLYRHAVLVVPMNRKLIAAGIGACVLVAGAILGTLERQRSDRIFADAYMSTLPPPALRIVSGVSVKQFVGEANALRAKLDRRAAVDDSHDEDEE